MPLTEIRATLDVELSETLSASMFDTYRVYNKKINLTNGVRHQVDSIQLFHNTFDIGDGGADGEAVIRHTFLSLYPQTFYDLDTDTVGDTVANAANDSIIYRKTEVFTVGTTTPADKIQQLIYSEEFPQSNLTQLPVQNFYTPHLYLTIMYEFPPNRDTVYLADPSVSLYMVVDEKPCDSVQYGMGLIKEKTAAMWDLRQASGVSILDSITSLGSNIFPMWKIGGIRPARMLTLNEQTESYLGLSSGEAESMRALTSFRTDFTAASQMVQARDAFGSIKAASDFPDWVADILMDMPGVISPLLGHNIPVLKNEDGTTRMVA